MRYTLRSLFVLVLIVACLLSCMALRASRIGFSNQLRALGGHCTYVWMGDCQTKDAIVTFTFEDPDLKVDTRFTTSTWYMPAVYTVGEVSKQNEWNPISLANWNLSSITIPFEKIDEQLLEKIKNEPELKYLLVMVEKPYEMDGSEIERLKSQLPETFILAPVEF